MKSFREKICPHCGSMKLKNWEDLTDDQKFLAERLPGSSEFSPEERKKHRFCERCWFEDAEKIEDRV